MYKYFMILKQLGYKTYIKLGNVLTIPNTKQQPKRKKDSDPVRFRTQTPILKKNRRPSIVNQIKPPYIFFPSNGRLICQLGKLYQNYHNNLHWPVKSKKLDLLEKIGINRALQNKHTESFKWTDKLKQIAHSKANNIKQ